MHQINNSAIMLTIKECFKTHPLVVSCQCRSTTSKGTCAQRRTTSTTALYQIATTQ